MGMYEGRMGGMYVPYGREILHFHYATCFGENIGQTVFVSLDLVLPCGMKYLHLMTALYNDVVSGFPTT